MKKSLSKRVLAAMLVPTIALSIVLVPTALAVYDYGQDLNGNQCASTLKEDGTCNILYTNDGSLKGDANSIRLGDSANVAQPNGPTNAERTAIQKEKRRLLCKIMFCTPTKAAHLK